VVFCRRFGDLKSGCPIIWRTGGPAAECLDPDRADREGNIISRLPKPDALVGKNMRKSHEGIMDGDTAGAEEAVGVDG